MIYGDLFLLINGLCDFWMLFLTALLMKRRPKLPRLLGGAAAGGLYALLHLYISDRPLLDVLLALAVSLSMVLLVFFPERPRFLFQASLCFYGVCLLLGGAVTPLYRLFRGEVRSQAAAMLLLLGLLLFLSLPLCVCLRMLSRRIPLKAARIDLTVDGKRKRLSGLVDSGNLLCDSATGLPVVIFSSDVFRGASLPAAHPLAVQSLCDSTELLVFQLQDLQINGRRVSAAAAIAPTGARFGGFRALIPESLLLT